MRYQRSKPTRSLGDRVASDRDTLKWKGSTDESIPTAEGPGDGGLGRTGDDASRARRMATMVGPVFRSPDLGTAYSGGMAQVESANIASGVAGRKPLFREELLDLAEPLGERLRSILPDTYDSFLARDQPGRIMTCPVEATRSPGSLGETCGPQETPFTNQPSAWVVSRDGNPCRA